MMGTQFLVPFLWVNVGSYIQISVKLGFLIMIIRLGLKNRKAIVLFLVIIGRGLAKFVSTSLGHFFAIIQLLVLLINDLNGRTRSNGR